MDKNIRIMAIIGIITIIVSILIAVVSNWISISQGNEIAEQNREDVKNLINEELKKLNEQQSELVQLSTPKPIINCWLSEKDTETGTYKIIIINEGNELAQLEDIKLESLRIFYRPITTKDFDSEVSLCELEDKWLSPGKTITQKCFSDFKVNHITLNTKDGEIICDLERVL